MIVKIRLTPEEAAKILEYEYADNPPSILPQEMTANQLRSALVQHYEATSAHCLDTFGKTGPINWARDIIRRARVR